MCVYGSGRLNDFETSKPTPTADLPTQPSRGDTAWRYYILGTPESAWTEAKLQSWGCRVVGSAHHPRQRQRRYLPTQPSRCDATPRGGVWNTGIRLDGRKPSVFVRVFGSARQRVLEARRSARRHRAGPRKQNGGGRGVGGLSCSATYKDESENILCTRSATVEKGSTSPVTSTEVLLSSSAAFLTMSEGAGAELIASSQHNCNRTTGPAVGRREKQGVREWISWYGGGPTVDETSLIIRRHLCGSCRSNERHRARQQCSEVGSC